MPDELKRLFDSADEALFNLHLAMERQMKGLPGAENWRDIYRMRVELNSIQKPMCENNFKRKTEESDAVHLIP